MSGDSYTVPYTIRGIELDANRTVSPGWLARILEDARWQVFALHGASMSGLLNAGVARACHYWYHVPLTYPDSVEITTWLARVGRSSFDFAHRMVRTRDRVVAVEARMTIVNLGPGGPAPVDPSLADLVADVEGPAARGWPEGERADPWSREWFVRPSDQDSFQHINQARYVDYIDDCRWFASAAGEPAGLHSPLGGLSVEYVQEAHAGERVRMETWITGEGARAYELTRQPGGEILSRGQAFSTTG